MESEDIAHDIDTDDRFWEELHNTVTRECETHSNIDDALRSYLTLVVESRGTVVRTEDDLDRCSHKLATSPLFSQHADYIRHQLVHSLLQEEDTGVLLVVTAFLLTDARTTERTFEILNNEGAFIRLSDLIASPKEEDEQVLHRHLMELLYEMSRIQKISADDLAHISDDFVKHLFDIIEQVSSDVTDPYHYPVIRVLLVLNEQFMVAAHDPVQLKFSLPLTNKVVKVLSAHGNRYKTFGENIILLLNREDETSLQLLTLKLLYLLFTTPPTYEYFYTNDLRVLVDILIRNLLDLPEEAAALRHTYLRVLYPLLEHTQLQYPPHHKHEEIKKLLVVLGGGQVLEEQDNGVTVHQAAHFNEIDETTKRLVRRCLNVSWLADLEAEPTEQTQSPLDEDFSEPASPVSPGKPQPPALPAPRKLKKRNSSKGSTLTIGQFLTPQLENARHSSVSMMEVAAQREKPGVITPSRNPSLKNTLRSTIMHKERPPLPKARRSGWTRMSLERSGTDIEITKTTIEGSKLPVLPGDAGTHVEPADLKGPVVTEDQTTLPSPRPHTPLATKPPPPMKPKKPPPAPKARRWGRGKQAKEAEDDRSHREPGKFDTKLPSINTNTKPHDGTQQNPFSPPVLIKSLSPEVPEQTHPSVSEALEQAQKEADSGITDTLGRVRLGGDEEFENLRVMPNAEGNGITVNRINETPVVVVQAELSHQPQTILTPPNPAPPRPIPGPEWEIERSPFLSDAELEDGSDAEDT